MAIVAAVVTARARFDRHMDRPSRSRNQESRLDPPEDHVTLIASRVDAIAARRRLPYPLSRFESLVQQVMWDVTEYRRNVVGLAARLFRPDHRLVKEIIG
jgi:hypothetical protein